MKLSIILPILAVSEPESNKNEDRSCMFGCFDGSEVTNLCSDQVPRPNAYSPQGGTFETSNNGLNGEIKLENYPNDVNCKHVVQADSTCEEIKIEYRSVAVEDGSNGCNSDVFRFGWPNGPKGFDVTPGRCGCFGDGCGTSLEKDSPGGIIGYSLRRGGCMPS